MWPELPVFQVLLILHVIDICEIESTHTQTNGDLILPVPHSLANQSRFSIVFKLEKEKRVRETFTRLKASR